MKMKSGKLDGSKTKQDKDSLLQRKLLMTLYFSVVYKDVFVIRKYSKLEDVS